MATNIQAQPINSIYNPLPQAQANTLNAAIPNIGERVQSQALQSAKTLEAIQSSRAQRDQAQQALDLQKKAQQANIDYFMGSGKMTQTQADAEKDQLNQQYKQTSSQLEDLNTHADIEQQKHTKIVQQAAQFLQQLNQSSLMNAGQQTPGQSAMSGYSVNQPQSYSAYAQQQNPNPAPVQNPNAVSPQAVQGSVNQGQPQQAQSNQPILPYPQSVPRLSPVADFSGKVGGVSTSENPMYKPTEEARLNWPKNEAMMENARTNRQTRQDALQNQIYNQATTALSKITSNRSGGLGLQDGKVNQAIHLRQLADQYYDPKTGSYEVPQAQLGEMVMGLANLVSNANVATVEGLRSITPKSFSGDTAGLISYWTGTPKTGNSQDMIKNLVDSIDRQGVVSEDLRDTYVNQIKNKLPRQLNVEDRERLINENVGNSFKDYLANRRSNIKGQNKTSDNDPLGIR